MITDMNSRRPLFCALALFACCLLAVPPQLQSQAAQAGPAGPTARRQSDYRPAHRLLDSRYAADSRESGRARCFGAT